MRSRNLLVVSLLAISGCDTDSELSVVLDTNVEGTSSYMRSSVREVGDKRLINVFFVFLPDSPQNLTLRAARVPPMKTTGTTLRVDCARREYDMIHTVITYGDGSKRTRPDKLGQAVIPDSPLEDAFIFACKPAWRRFLSLQFDKNDDSK